MNEKLNIEIENLRQYLKEMDDFPVKNVNEFINSRIKNLALSMLIFSSINCTIEIGEIIISKYSFETPLKYREIFEILIKNNVITEKTGTKLSSFIYQRNMIAHQYGKIKLEKIYEVIIEKEIFITYTNEIINYIKYN